jgi:uncharacterized protein YgiM (DUF1202 family)
MSHFRTAAFLVTTLSFATLAHASFVQSTALNCRAAPSVEAEVIKKFNRAEEVVVTETMNGWARTQVTDEVSCWVSEEFLAETAPEEVTPEPEARSSFTTPFVPERRASSAPRQSEAPRAKRSTGGACSCEDNRVCVGPRGGRYCLNSSGTKRYGV